MEFTQSGYPVVETYGIPPLIDNPDVPGTGVQLLGGIHEGDVATVLIHVATRFHREVEPLVQSHGVWGYDKRKINGGAEWSNHASGTAIDLNSNDHQQGRRGSFSKAQVDAIHAIVDSYDGVIAWGGDWDDGSVDEMHFQIDNGQAPNVAALAARLRSPGDLPGTETTINQYLEDIMANAVIYHAGFNGTMYEVNLLTGTYWAIQSAEQFENRKYTLKKAGIPFEDWPEPVNTLSGFGLPEA